MSQRIGSKSIYLYIVLFFFVFGISAGAFSEIFLDDTMHSEMSSYILSLFNGGGGDLSSSQVFWNSLKNNGILLALMAVGGITLVGFPVALFVLAYKGASLGFTFALMADVMGAKGILSSMVTMLFQNIILIPMFFVFCFFTLNLSLETLLGKEKRRRSGIYQDTMSIYGICFLGAVIALVIGCLVEAYFSSNLIRIL